LPARKKIGTPAQRQLSICTAARRSLGRRTLGHPVDVGVAAILTPHAAIRVHGSIARKSRLSVVESSALGDRRLHRHSGEHLQQMVLHDVTQGATLS